MEIMVSKEKRERTERFMKFAENLTDQEAREFEVFIKGYMLAKGAEVKKSA